MARINGNDLANAVARLEGKKVKPRFKIGQVREIIRLTRQMLKAYDPDDVAVWVRR